MIVTPLNSYNLSDELINEIYFTILQYIPREKAMEFSYKLTDIFKERCPLEEVEPCIIRLLKYYKIKSLEAAKDLSNTYVYFLDLIKKMKYKNVTYKYTDIILQ